MVLPAYLQGPGPGTPAHAYDEFPLPGTTGSNITTGTVTISNVVPDGFSLKVTRLTLSNKAGTGLVSIQITTAVTGLQTVDGLTTKVIFEYELGGTSSVQFSEDDLEMVVPAGFKLQAFMSAGTLDIQGQARYLKGSF